MDVEFLTAPTPTESYTDKMAKTTEITNSNNFSEQPPPSLGFTAATSPGHVSLAAMREVIFRSAAMQPIHIDPEAVKPPKRRNVRISKDPQSVAARHRRERISERIRILQRLVPGGTKMDTASMLEEAVHYMKFLKTQLQSLERAAAAAGNWNAQLGLLGLDWRDLNYSETSALIPYSFDGGECSSHANRRSCHDS